MSSDGWRYIAQRLNGDGTATFLHMEVPLRDVEIEDVLSGPGGLTGTIDPEVAHLKDSDGRPLFDEWSTALFAENGGEIRGGGILTHSGFDGPAWAMECTGFHGYAQDMPYVGNGANYIKVDTLDIYRNIWAHIQGQVGGNIGLEIDPDKSGVLVGSELASEQYDPEGGAGGLTLQSQAYKLAWYQDHDLSENLTSLATQSPFDFHETHYWSGDEIKHRIQFGVPRIYARRDDLRFTIGENVFEKPSVERAGDEYADEVYFLGAGEGSQMVRGYARAALRQRLRRPRVMTDSTLRTLAQANAEARGELSWRLALDDFTEIVVRDSPHAPIGSVSVGDEIRVNGLTGWVEVDSWYRVISRTIRPSEPNAMSLTIARSDRLA